VFRHKDKKKKTTHQTLLVGTQRLWKNAQVGCGTNVLFSLEQKKSPHLKMKKKVGGRITKKPA